MLYLGLFLYILVLLAERALVEPSPHDLETLAADDHTRSRRAYRLAADPQPALAALLLARVLLKVSVTLLAGYHFLNLLQVRNLFDALLDGGQDLLPFKIAVWLLLALSAAFLFWLIGKLGLDRIIKRSPVTALQALGGFTGFWYGLFYIFVRKLQNPKGNPSAPTHQTEIHGKPTEQQTSAKRDLELLKSIVKFSDVTIKQVMQPRSKVMAVDFRLNFHELMLAVREAGFSRMPVYDDDLDNVTGILYVKDLVEYLDNGPEFEWQSLIRTNVLLVPESKRISELLQEFKKNKMHMAIVVDEYGGSSGIVTMEDILEEVTGEIRDEFDEESDIPYRKLDEQTYLFEGQTLLNDVCRITGLAADAFDEVRGNADTLAGLALEIRGDIPPPGAEIEWKNILLTVTQADNRRIQQLRMKIR